MLSINTVMIVDDEDDREFFIEAVDKINSYIQCMNLDTGEKARQYLKDESPIMPIISF